MTARTGRNFRLFKGGVEFHPGDGAALHFASKAADTLTLPELPAGTLSRGDQVRVEYAADGQSYSTVFRGTVERIVRRRGRGDLATEEVTVSGPWAAMNRLVFRQKWATKSADGTPSTFLFSRVVLNRSVTGDAFTIDQQIREILDYAAQKCGFSVGTIAADTARLPADDTRDLTCASALLRELRFHPRTVCRFDYAPATPVLSVSTPAENAEDAAYVATIPKTSREYEMNAHPITAVDIQTNDVDLVAGGVNVSAAAHQVYPANADTTGLDVLHVYIPLARGSGSTSYESIELETEDMPSYVGHPGFWKEKHPRLANVAISQIRISEATRTGGYQYIARNSASELRKANIQFAHEVFKCKCTITTEDDVEEDIFLTMEFLTCNRRGGTITWQTGSSSMAGETLPDGLAEAIYRQRTQSAFLNEWMTVRLGARLPHLGDMADGLMLQEFDVDLAALTATLHFGQPDYLSAEDMRDLLNGFRGRAYSSVQTIRENADDDEAAEEIAGIPPLSSTEFAPGTKAKTTIKSASSGGIISLDSASLENGDKATIRKAKVIGDDGGEREVCILSTEDVDLTAAKSVNGLNGKVKIIGGKGVAVSVDGQSIKITADADKDGDDDQAEEADDPCAHDPSGAAGGVPADDGSGDGHIFGGGGVADGGAGGGVPADDAGGGHTGDDNCNCN